MADKLVREQNRVVVPSNLERVLMKAKSESLLGRLSGWRGDWIDWDYYPDTSDDWDGDNFWAGDINYIDYDNSSYSPLYRSAKANNTYETLSEAFRLLYK